MRSFKVTIACLAVISVGVITGCAPTGGESHEVTHRATNSSNGITTQSATATPAPSTPSSGVTSQNIEGIIYYTGGYPTEWPAHIPRADGNVVFLNYMPELDQWSVVVEVDPASASNQMARIFGELAGMDYYMNGWQVGWRPMGEFIWKPDSTTMDCCGYGKYVDVLSGPCPQSDGACIAIGIGPGEEVCDGSPSQT